LINILTNECSILYNVGGIVERGKKKIVRIWLFFYGEIATLKDLAYISKLMKKVEKKYQNFNCRFKHTKCTNND
jgi:hypothetical protein